MIYRKFEIIKCSEETAKLYYNGLHLTTFVKSRALKKLINRYYDKTLNEFEKIYIFGKLNKEVNK